MLHISLAAFADVLSSVIAFPYVRGYYLQKTRGCQGQTAKRARGSTALDLPLILH